MGKKILIVYYSTTSHTREVAELIQKTVGGDLASIRTKEPYPEKEEDKIAQGRREVSTDFMPELNDFPVDIGEYDTIFLGTPVWWYTIAPAMKSFLKNHDLSGKIIYPFVTSEGSAGHALNHFAADVGDCFVKSGLHVRFGSFGMVTKGEQIENWAKDALQ